MNTIIQSFIFANQITCAQNFNTRQLIITREISFLWGNLMLHTNCKKY